MSDIKSNNPHLTGGEKRFKASPLSEGWVWSSECMYII